jgi:hypothetical protein
LTADNPASGRSQKDRREFEQKAAKETISNSISFASIGRNVRNLWFQIWDLG